MFRRSLLIVLAIAAHAAIGASARAATVPKTDIKIDNVGHVIIDGVYARPAGGPANSTNWGPDLLSGVIHPAYHIILHLPPHGPCTYDLRVTFPRPGNGSAATPGYFTSDRLNVNICRYSSLAFAGPPVGAPAVAPLRLKITNGGHIPVVRVYVVPSVAKNWGSDRLIGLIHKNHYIHVNLRGTGRCMYDVRVDFQNGTREERFRTNICDVNEMVFVASVATAQNRPGAPPSPVVLPAPAPAAARGLTLQNAYRVPIVQILASPSQLRTFGHNRLRSGQAVLPGSQFHLDLAAAGGCVWDVKAVFANEASQSIYRTNVCSRGQAALIMRGPPPGRLLATGTGFYINHQGYLMTNNHVVYGCAMVAIARKGSSPLPLKVIGQDSTDDLAILQEPAVTTPAVVFRAPAQRLRVGARAVALGFPLRDVLGSLIVTQGIVSSLMGTEGDSSEFQMQTPIQSGNSGGPVLDRHGQVIGISVASLNPKVAQTVENANFAVQATVAKRFADSLGIQVSSGSSTRTMSTADIVEMNRDRVVPLNCYN
ncbi:MAG TPA: S1C family serine protease [Acetobacteraceae bacterium]|nr:S1C family serine protease [Acetobacteraceae bacterium]